MIKFDLIYKLSIYLHVISPNTTKAYSNLTKFLYKKTKHHHVDIKQIITACIYIDNIFI